jgi:hypothetical protein
MDAKRKRGRLNTTGGYVWERVVPLILPRLRGEDSGLMLTGIEKTGKSNSGWWPVLD